MLESAWSQPTTLPSRSSWSLAPTQIEPPGTLLKFWNVPEQFPCIDFKDAALVLELECNEFIFFQALDDRAAFFEVVVQDLVGGLDDVVVTAKSTDKYVVSTTTEQGIVTEATI